MDTWDVVRITEVAFQYGPFLFSLLFTVWLSRWAHGIYSRACERTTPPATGLERATYCSVFVLIVLFGMGLVTVSVAWWFWYRPTIYAFRGEITALNDYATVRSNDVYFRPRRLGTVVKGVPELRDEEFVALSPEPFKPNQQFILIYWKEGNDPEQFEITYTKNPQPIRYKVEWDEQQRRNVLRPMVQSASGTAPSKFKAGGAGLLDVLSGRAAWAGTAEDPLRGRESRPSQQREWAAADELIRELQNERTGVGAKIKALDTLATWPDAELRGVAEVVTAKEPMLVTLLDLGRHSDRELAFKANALLRRIDTNSLLERSLRSGDQRRVEAATTTLRRMEKEQALRVLERTETSQSASLRRLTQEIASGQGTQALHPTGSASGDRYYVKAEWDPGSAKTVDCLTQLFNRSLIGRPPLEQEREFMKGRRERYVYWYNKEWAVNITKEIERCGAKAAFVSP